MSDDNHPALPRATDDRLPEIRKRIQRGFYLEAPVLDMVAVRIAASGDWEGTPTS